MRCVRITSDAFDTATEIVRLEALGGGGVASFTGIVRGDAGFLALTLDHYPAMTQSALESLVAQAEQRWPLVGVTLIHRVGDMVPGDRIVFVGTASAHRAAALEACAFLIDCLKTQAPFWKKEQFADGTNAWVEPRDSDDAAAARW